MKLRISLLLYLFHNFSSKHPSILRGLNMFLVLQILVKIGITSNFSENWNYFKF